MDSNTVQRLVADRIRVALALRQRSTRWLSDATAIPNLEQKLDGEVDVTVTELAAIAEALSVPGASLLPHCSVSDDEGDPHA